jgi:glycosyltransferase involved in cell wall biosynthesis
LPALVASPNWETAQMRRIFKLSNRVIVLDPASADAVSALVPGRSVSVIPNPAWKVGEVTATTTVCGQTKTIVFVGHVIPAKGVRELVLACRDIRGTAFRLNIVGSIEKQFRQELEAVARARDDGEWLTISGQVKSEEALSCMAGAFAVALPSYTEGFPNAILEAMMLSKPVIATPVGAISQMLSFDGDEPCGVCVPVRDVDALRIAIQSLLIEPSRALELGRRGRERLMREYLPQAAYARYKSIWESAARDRRHSTV